MHPEDAFCGKSKIVHVDVDAFFASVEQILHPEWRGRPVLVGRGVVASASYEAKARGVSTAMSFARALRLCPDAVVAAGKYENYAEFGRRLKRLLTDFTPAVEMASLDDFYLDMTGTDRLFPRFRRTLAELQRRVSRDLGLTVSLGAAVNKTTASIASRLHRPRGFVLVPPGAEAEFLAALPIEKLPGVGHSHHRTLAERGVSTIGELRRLPLELLTATFGEAIGRQLHERARGLDPRPVETARVPRSISRETTIEKGSIDTEFLDALLEYLAERIGATLRAQQLQAGTLLLRLRYTDELDAHRSAPLEPATNDSKALAAAAGALLGALFNRRVAVRWMGLTVTRLVPESLQNHLFDRQANRRWYLNRSLDRMRERFGWNCLYFGRGLELRRHYQTDPDGLVLSTPCLSR